MKNLLAIFLMSMSSHGISQEWKVLTEADIGYSFFAASNIEVDPLDNSIWFGEQYRISNLKDGAIVTNILYSDEIPFMNDVQDFAILNGVLYGIDNTEGLFKIEAGIFSIVEPLMKYGLQINVGQTDSLLVGTLDLNNIGYYTFKDGAYSWYSELFGSGIEGDEVYQVFEDSYQRTWFTYLNSSTNGMGITLLDSGQWRWFNWLNSNLIDPDVKKINQSPTGEILLTSDFGLCKYDEVLEDWIIYDTSNTNMPSESIRDIEFDSAGRTWAIFKDLAIGYTYNYTDWIVYDEANSPVLNGDYFDMTIDTLDNVWVGGAGRLYVFNPNSIQGWASTYENNLNFSVYPNPVINSLNISSTSPFEEIFIYNIQGEIVYSQKGNFEKININVEDYTKGIYFISVVSKEGQIYQDKFIKQ